jgi:hypothetical protein
MKHSMMPQRIQRLEGQVLQSFLDEVVNFPVGMLRSKVMRNPIYLALLIGKAFFLKFAIIHFYVVLLQPLSRISMRIATCKNEQVLKR